MLRITGSRACALLCLPACAQAQTIVVEAQRLPAADTPASQASIDAADIRRTINAIEVQDTLKYLPSLFLRRRHVGDTQATLATRTAGVGSSARSLVYADGVLLSALIGNNNTTASPRWGLVSPEEIARVDVTYGPFSAAYPGNAIGAVVNMTLRRPETLEASVAATGQLQRFRQYGTRDSYPAGSVAATLGDRIGRLSVFLAAERLHSEAQPLVYATALRPATPSATGTPVTGAIPDLNRLNQPIAVVGATGLENQEQTRLKARLSLDLGGARLTYAGGLFLNDTDARAESYLRDTTGAPLFAGTINIAGYAYTLPASLFSNNVYRQDQRHSMHALTLESGAGGTAGWQIVASRYRYDHDRQRLPTTALPSARTGGAGAIVRLDGTGWETLDATAHVDAGVHRLRAGGHLDRFTLRNERFATADWRTAPAGALLLAARGHTRTGALWLEDGWRLAAPLTLTLGARQEWWRAYGGRNISAAPLLDVRQPTRSEARLSPKASLAWGAGATILRASIARAWRFPTVSELYQVVTTGPTLSVPDPTLRPERASSAELAVERGGARLSLFAERIDDALISQTAPLVPGSTQLFSFVQNVDRTRARGIEVAFDRRDWPVRGIDLVASATYADAETVRDRAFPAAEGKRLPQVPRWRSTLAATWRLSDPLALTAAWRHAGRQFGTIDNSDVRGHTYQGFEGYDVVDLRAALRLGPHWEAALGCDNLLGERYFLFHPFPGRTLTAQLRWHL